jgi:2-polyprenyl-3-methyl-5-hydroxy-6-metoxy-1,4-benzoquinol methylase
MIATEIAQSTKISQRPDISQVSDTSQFNEIAQFTERAICINCGGSHLTELSSGRFDEGLVQQFIDEDPWGEHPAPFLQGQSWALVACKDCGQKFHRYILNSEWNERRFSKWMSQDAIAAFEQVFKTPANAFRSATSYTAHVLQIEQLTRPLRASTEATRVLDFGCGYGGFLSMCSAYGFAAYGVDRSAAKRTNGVAHHVYAELEDIAHLPPFHALTLFEVLEHLDDPHGLMLLLRERLVKGGILVLETPDCSGINDIHTKEEYYKIHPLEHINAFTPDTLKQFAMRLGFEPISKPVSCITCDSAALAKSTAKRLLAPVLKPSTQLYFRKLA